MNIPRPLWPAIGAGVAIGLLRLIACGSQDNLYEDRPATVTTHRCGEANDPQCEP